MLGLGYSGSPMRRRRPSSPIGGAPLSPLAARLAAPRGGGVQRLGGPAFDGGGMGGAPAMPMKNPYPGMTSEPLKRDPAQPMGGLDPMQRQHDMRQAEMGLAGGAGAGAVDSPLASLLMRRRKLGGMKPDTYGGPAY